jgi:hypothetical protein
MASEIIQNKESRPIINPPAPKSAATGYNNIAQALGQIAERTIIKATDYEAEASKANLLQTHGMLQDVEAQSKIEILKNPGHAEAIAKNAENTALKIQKDARLNRDDRLSLKEMSDNAVRGLKLTAAEKTISLSRERAKYAALSSLGDTLSSIRRDIFLDPTKADALIGAQYEALKGQVNAGIITAVEGANIHKQFTKELEFAHELVSGMKEGVLSASDLSAYHATDPSQVPMSNAHLPMDVGTAMGSDHHFGQLTLSDIQSKIANGDRVSPRDLVSIKKISDLDHILNYGMGAAKATGDINSGMSWIELNHKLDVLKKKEKRNSVEEGYKNRLNNFINEAKQPGHYQNFIAGTPEGARVYQDFAQTQTAIEKDTPFGTAEQVAFQKHVRSNENLNNLISKSDALGIAMHYPDYLRQPVPIQLLTPIQNAFNKDGDINTAINNILTLNPKNRMYVMNAFPGNYRKQLTVMDIGNLAGKADAGFMVDLFASQQIDALGAKGQATKRDSQEKFLQLDTSKEGLSDKKLISKISPLLTNINAFLSNQPNGGQLVSAKIDQAMRYVKKVAADHNDYTYEHVDDYLKTYQTNMDAAYGVKTGFNFVVSTNDLPLEDNQIQVLASHAINEAKTRLLEYKSQAQVDAIFANTPPRLVSSPGGRIMVVYPNGHAVSDVHGQPAFSEIYTESVWHKAEADMAANTNAENPLTITQNPFLSRSPHLQLTQPYRKVIRGEPDIVRPLKEGNIELEGRPKVWNEKGQFETVKTITREFDGKTVLLPTIINGKEVSVKEATEHYKKTGEHLGIFKNREDANKYDKQLHERMGWRGESNKWETK